MHSSFNILVAMATKYFISSHFCKLIMQFGLCILEDCSYILGSMWKNITQKAKSTIDDVTPMVKATGVT